MKQELTGEDEDMIFKNLVFIRELTEVQEMYFDTMCEELSLNEIGIDWLYDYIHNGDKKEEFPVYLERYGVDQSTIFKKQ